MDKTEPYQQSEAIARARATREDKNHIYLMYSHISVVEVDAYLNGSHKHTNFTVRQLGDSLSCNDKPFTSPAFTSSTFLDAAIAPTRLC